MVTFLFAPSVPVSLMYKFLPFDVAPLSNANARSPVPNCQDDKYPVDNCSKICKFVFVIVPQRPAFSPVVISSSFELVEKLDAIILLVRVYWCPNH